VRILRVARFAARFNEFTIAPETLELMCNMVQAGEVDALVPERVWQELSRGLMEAVPSRMLQVLHECGALARIMPEMIWSPAAAQQRSQTVDFAAAQKVTLAVRWAVLSAECDESICRTLCARMKVPVEARDIALLTCREHRHIYGVLTHSPEAIVSLLERCDAFRRAERFAEILRAVQCRYLLPADFIQQSLLDQSLAAALSIPARHIALETAQRYPNQPQQIAAQIFRARVNAVGQLSHFHRS